MYSSAIFNFPSEVQGNILLLHPFLNEDENKLHQLYSFLIIQTLIQVKSTRRDNNKFVAGAYGAENKEITLDEPKFKMFAKPSTKHSFNLPSSSSCIL